MVRRGGGGWGADTAATTAAPAAVLVVRIDYGKGRWITVCVFATALTKCNKEMNGPCDAVVSHRGNHKEGKEKQARTIEP